MEMVIYETPDAGLADRIDSCAGESSFTGYSAGVRRVGHNGSTLWRVQLLARDDLDRRRLTAHIQSNLAVNPDRIFGAQAPVNAG
jgi:hypothetical protein